MILWAVVLVAPLPVLHYGLVGLWHGWAAPEFRLKAVAPFLALLLLARRLPALTGPAGRSGWLGPGLAAIAMAIALLGNALLVDHLVNVALVLYVVAVAVAVVGPAGALRIWAPIAALVMMLPVPRFLYAAIADRLEAAVAWLTVEVLFRLQVPVFVEGPRLEFAFLSIERGQLTDGLHALLPSTLLALFALCLVPVVVRAQFVLIALVLPVVMLLSTLRAIAAGWLAASDGEAAALGFLEWTGGWWLVAAMAVLILGLAWLLPRDRHSEPAPDPLALARALSRGVRRQMPVPLVAVAIVAAAASALHGLGPSVRAELPEREPFSRFPPDASGWVASAAAVDAGTAAILKADDHLALDLVMAGEAAPVGLWVAYYGRQEPQNAAIHAPALCLPNGGWTILRSDVISMPGLPGLRVTRSLIEKDRTRALVAYWFEGRGRRFASDVRARASYRIDGLVRGRTDGALVRYVTEIQPGELEGSAAARLERAIAATAPLLPRFILE